MWYSLLSGDELMNKFDSSLMNKRYKRRNRKEAGLKRMVRRIPRLSERNRTIKSISYRNMSTSENPQEPFVFNDLQPGNW